MVRVALIGMRFHAYHGVHVEEHRFGAPFVVDVEIDAPEPPDDDVAEAVDYARVHERVAAVVTGERVALLETLAARIADAVMFGEPRARSLRVRVHKPHAPLPGVVADVWCEVHRER
jgi:7,8-dihydroneopterin aldolase/epimerase/oxygenase